MKRALIVLILINTAIIAKGQDGYTFNAFSIGVGGGITAVNDYTVAPLNKYAISGTLSYNITPFFSLTGEAQLGKLGGGNTVDFSNKRYLNNYDALLLHADMQLGELVEYGNNDFLYGLKDLYLGTGIGAMQNHINYVETSFNSTPNFYNTVLDATNILVPFRIGYDYKMYNNYAQPQIRLDIGYTYTMAIGQGIDGYVTTAPVKFYGFFSVGVKFGFGNDKPYRKPLVY